jgi:hypothetical protein
VIIGGRRCAPVVDGKDEAACERDIRDFRMPSHDPTAMYRMSLVRDIEYLPSLKVAEGLDYILRVGERFGMRVLPECLYSYRIHESSLTRSGVLELNGYVRLALHAACARRGLSFETVFGRDPAAKPRRRTRKSDTALVRHFISSVKSLKQGRELAAALSVGLACAALQPCKLRHYRPLVYACTPNRVLELLRRRAASDIARRIERGRRQGST